MEHSTSTKQRDILNIQNSTEEHHTNNSNSNYERQQIEHTPFWVIGDPENGYNLIMGKWKLTTEPHKTKNDLKLWMNKNKWNIILSMIICATQDINEENKKEQEKEEENFIAYMKTQGNELYDKNKTYTTYEKVENLQRT